MQHSQNIICNDKETRTVHRLPPPPTLHLVTAAQWRHQPQVADTVDIQILEISTQWCSELSLECPIIRLYSQSPVHHCHDILIQMGCALHCTVLYCPVPGESQLDGFLCWLLPVSPCTVTIHSSSTSLALDYVITLPTTTTTQGAGGDISPPPHSCRSNIWPTSDLYLIHSQHSSNILHKHRFFGLISSTKLQT